MKSILSHAPRVTRSLGSPFCRVRATRNHSTTNRASHVVVFSSLSVALVVSTLARRLSLVFAPPVRLLPPLQMLELRETTEAGAAEACRETSEIF